MRGTDLPAVLAKARYWDRVVDTWHEQSRDAVWRAHSDAVNGALLSRWLPPRHLRHVLKTDLFDEAVAEGLYPVLQRGAQQVTGIDISARVVDAARTRYPLLKAITADVLRLPFNDGEFQAVISFSTLDHFDSADQISSALCELHRVLSPGGTLVITLDNGSNPAVALRNRLPYPLLRRLRLVLYENGVTYTPSRFVALLRSCHFEVGDLAFSIHSPRVVAVLMARVVERSANPLMRSRFLRWLATGERLGRWPSRALTGYFIAALATKR
jgi:SAM-dependent methyltransferase